uniref:DUF223 domain-containing protein n=1 Tax=Brassica oleracea TaxID=3712 RepID=A0A3P6ETQ7_BRAOL|nr:unnamed protein product [Brassica oleracea]
MEPTGNSPDSSDRKTGKKIVASSATVKPNGKSIASSAIAKTDVSSPVPVKPNVATDLSSVHADQVMLFRDVSFGPREAELRFRLIHFWEARNPLTKTLIGQAMLLIDEEGTAIQGFVPAGRVGTFDLTDGVMYKLNNFFGFHGYEEFRANCDSKGDLYDYVGNMKLVNGQTISDHIVLDEVDISEKRHICVHVQIHDGPVMKLYIWDKAASDLRQIQILWRHPKLPSSYHLYSYFFSRNTRSHYNVIISKVFMDADVQPSKDYLEWYSFESSLSSNLRHC